MWCRADQQGSGPGLRRRPGGHRLLVASKSRNQVVVIDPNTFTVTRRVDVPGCEHPHGLTLAADHRVGFIACDGNATVHTLDLDTDDPGDPQQVGDNPDVIAYDPGDARLYVAAEAAPSPC